MILTFTLGLLVKLATTTSYIPVPIPNGASQEMMLHIALYDLTDAYKMSYKTYLEMEKVILCESQWKVTALNPHDPITRSVGLLQFKDQTFQMMASDLELPDADINNPFHQLEVFVWAWANGKQSHWSCYNKTVSKVGKTHQLAEI